MNADENALDHDKLPTKPESRGEIKRKRGGRRYRRKRRNFLQVNWMSRITNRTIVSLCCLLTACITLFAFISFIGQSAFYSQAWLGAPKPEIKYGLGDPQHITHKASDEIWRYEYTNRSEFIYFSGGRVSKIRCISRYSQCPGILGVPGDTDESGVYLRMGEPDYINYLNDVKTITYSDIGLKFIMSRYKIIGIEIYKSNSGYFSKLDHFLFFLLP